MRSAKTHTETGNDFVKDEERAVFVGKFKGFLVVIEVNGTSAAFGAHGFNDDASRAAAKFIASEHTFQHFQVVGADFVGGAEAAFGNAVAFKKVAASGDFQTIDHLVGPAVICASDFDDAFVFGCTTGYADCRHDGFCARAEHTEHFARRHMFIDLFCKQKFRFVEKTGNGTAGFDKFDRLFLNFGEVAAEDCRAARLQEVEVFVAVRVVKVCAFGFYHAHGEGFVESKVVLNAAGDILFCLGGDCFGFRALFVEVVFDDVLIRCVRYAIDGFAREFVQLVVDVLRFRPFALFASVTVSAHSEVLLTF